MDAHTDGTEMTKIATGYTLGAALLAICCAHEAWSAEVRAKADVTCKPTEAKLEYDCTSSSATPAPASRSRTSR